MLKAVKSSFIVSLFGFLVSCATTKAPLIPDYGPSDFSHEQIKRDMTYLSSDAMRGRQTGSIEYRTAAKFVADRFKALGLQPGTKNASYLQEVPVRAGRLDVEQSTFQLTIGGKKIDLVIGEDFFMSSSPRRKADEVSGELVFAGYGIHAPRFGHDDLKGLDLKGKIAVIFSGAPPHFVSATRAHHSNTAVKLDNLMQRGALGYLLVNSHTDELRVPFATRKVRLGQKRIGWFDESDVKTKGKDVHNKASDNRAAAMISPDIAHRIFKASSLDFNQLSLKAPSGDYQTGPLKAHAHLQYRNILGDIMYSPNVVGLLLGKHSRLRNEVIVITAHLDHIGVNENFPGPDKINNGAIDNASGIAAMLEVARAFTVNGNRPDRSIIFLALTGEEHGLMGAEYFMTHPTVPKSQIKANINMDMPIILYDFSDFVAFGSEFSSIGEAATRTAKHTGLKISPDPFPERNVFARSDHYRFMQHDVPAVMLSLGWGQTKDGIDGGAIFRDWLKNTYHKPHDDMTQDINFKAAAKFAYLNWVLATDLANGKRAPYWYPNNFFGKPEPSRQPMVVIR